MSRVLIARGVRGLIVAPVTFWRTPRLFFDWKQFAAVEIANTVWTPKFHRMESDTSHGNTLLEALRLLKKRGYRRIGFAMHANDLRRRRWGPLATFLLFQHLCPGLPKLAPLDHSRGFAPHFVGFEKWLANERPDVIVTAGPSMQEKLESIGVKVPEEIGILRIDCTPQNQCSGLAPDYHGIAEAAVRMLTRMLDYGELGLPSFPIVLQQPAIWQDGNTLKSLG